jgi:uncharacterized protein YcaQ
VRTLSSDHARRIALTAMGFARPRPGPAVRRDVRHLRRVLDTVDIVQLDSVNVLARAHELPFWSRLGPHDRRARDRWLWRSDEAYEGWVHVASVTDVEVWPLLWHRREAARRRHRAGTVDGVTAADRAGVLAEVAERGPSSVRDLEDPGERTGPWWGNPRGRRALDQLFRAGELAVHHRTPTFVTVYDLTERVVPDAVRQVEVPVDEARRRLLARAVRAHGIGTAADLADHHRLPVRVARRALTELVDDGEVEEVRVRGWGAEPVYRHPDAGAARRFPARCLLSPFDPLVWRRERAERLFGFRYRIEIYVPEPQRVHGYYVLPFLLGERLVARVDLKADRRAGRLRVRASHLEPGVDRFHVARELAAELTELGAWLEVPEVVVEDRGELAGPLRRAVG